MPRKGEERPKVNRREQLEAILASDLDEGARVLWAYLSQCARRGLGRERLRDRLDLVDFDAAVEILKEEGLLSTRGGNFRALPFLIRAAAEEGEEDTGPTPLRQFTETLLSEYNAARRAAGVVLTIEPTDRDWAKLEDLAGWLTDTDVEFTDFLAFAVEKTAFMRERAENKVKFPPLNVLCGPWLRGEFLETPTTGRVAHAGKRYDERHGLREQLRAAGFTKTMTAADEDHVQTWAENMAADPVGFPQADPAWRGEILWVLRRLKTEAVRARGA